MGKLKSVDTALAEHLAVLEERQAARRAHLAQMVALVEERQREIDNLASRLDK